MLCELSSSRSCGSPLLSFSLLEMAPATMEELRHIADDTVENVKGVVLDTTGFVLEADLRCELLWATSHSNQKLVALDNPIPRRVCLVFLYRCALRDDQAAIVHAASCRNVVARGYVPLPPYWKGWLSAIVIPQKAAALAAELGAEGRVQAEVHVLGAPRKITSTCDRGLQSGALFQLSGDVEPRVVLLCAALDDMIWLCHPGSYVGEEICADDPFREAGILEVDLRNEALQPDPDAARKGALLFDAAQKNYEAFGRVCAYAVTRVWLRRARSQSQRPPIEKLTDFFEPFPFDWKETECRGEITQTFLWIWRWTDEQVWHFAWRRQIVKNSLAKAHDISMPEMLREYLLKVRASTTEEQPQSEA